MMDEVELTKKTERAARAKELLESELLNEGFSSLRQEYLEAWKITHFKNVDGRERLWQAIQIIGKVENHLKKIVIDGRVASRDLAQLSHPKR